VTPIEVIKFQEQHILMWRKLINKHMMKEFGVTIEFFPKIEGDE